MGAAVRRPPSAVRRTRPGTGEGGADGAAQDFEAARPVVDCAASGKGEGGGAARDLPAAGLCLPAGPVEPPMGAR